ncbi:hypothetical protein B7463_g6884, partial [Scytalidium lignicola]
MASSDILSQTLSSITTIKLEELSSQQASFEVAKNKLLQDVAAEPDQLEKAQILLDKIESLPSMGKLNQNASTSLKNYRRFLAQARTDPSVSVEMQRDWQQKLENELNVNSFKYEYASLYGQLVNEWISAAEGNSDAISIDESAFESVGRKEMHDQRATWEEYVFKAYETDTKAIEEFLDTIFSANKETKKALEKLRESTQNFEKLLKTSSHFNQSSLKWVIEGLLRSDLVSDEKRAALKDFLNNKVVLAEVADVLNMRMDALDKWNWDPEGTPVEQRRQLNGRYRFYHDEDLLQSILLRYVGTKWSVHMKDALTKFHDTAGVWKSSSVPVPADDRKRRDYFLGPNYNRGETVEHIRAKHFNDDIFLEQLQETTIEKRAGYEDDDDDMFSESDTRKSPQQVTQSVLHALATEIIMRTRIGEEVTVLRSDFKWFGPSIPHSTMFAALKFFGVSEQWVDFFRRVLEAPMKFINDGPSAPVQVRKRGTPISAPLSDFLGESVLFCLDFALNQYTDGALLYRLHDDIWLWGRDETVVKGWKVITHFASLTGLEFNEEKTGSVRIPKRGGKQIPPPTGLPRGDVRWGFLKLDAVTGRFLIDQADLDKHIEELRRQLDACKSVFDWIQAWNVYGARFFTTNFGRPANCFGRQHVDMMLEAFAQIQSKLFTDGGSVTSTVKSMLASRFNVHNIPEGYLYFPMSMGGLDLKSPFVNLFLIKPSICPNPEKIMDDFFEKEETAYKNAQALFKEDAVPGQAFLRYELKSLFAEEKEFMSFEEFTRYREQTSSHLAAAYRELMLEPKEEDVDQAIDANQLNTVSGSGYRNGYERWIMELYAPDMIKRFGGLMVVEKGLLPTGMVNMFRESRFKWQG